MRILFFDTFSTESGKAGGVQAVTRRIIRGMARHGHHCIVVDPYGDIKETLRLPVDQNIEIIPLLLPYDTKVLGTRTRPLLSVLKLLRTSQYVLCLKNVIVRANVDVVWSSFPKSMFWSLPASRLAKRPIIYQCHGAHRLNPWFRFVLRKANHVVAVSQATRDQISRISSSTPVDVIYNSVGERWFEEPVDKDKVLTLRAQWRADARATVFLYLGTILPIKGPDVLLKALSHGLREGCLRNTKIVLAGDGPSAYVDEIRQLASSLGLDEHVVFIGYVNDPLSVIDACDVLVLPSRLESFGLVLIEAMARRKPVIASDIPGPREVLGRVDAGILFPPEDYVALANAMCHMVQDHEKRLSLSLAGYHGCREWFAEERQIRAIERLIQLISGAQVGLD